jgi:FkbM family methyltransferase
VDYCFVDGGANFGFWSVLASSRPFGSHPVVAIEASSRNAAKLTRNAELNGGRFKILHRAVGSTSGNKVWLSGAKHEAFRVGEANGAAGESVEMISLDGLIDQGHVAPGKRFIIKLDVEGMETDAVKGGQRLLQNECAIILEDHGADREHLVSRHVMENTPCRVFIFDEVKGQYVAVTELKMLDRIKTSTNFGYNIIATNSPFWEERIRSIAPSVRH